MSERPPTKYAMLVSLAEDLTKVDMSDVDLMSEVVRLRDRAVTVLAAKHVRNPDFHRAQLMGAEFNRQRGQATRDRVLPVIQKLRAEGHTTFQALAEQLTALNVPAPRGKGWHRSTVRLIEHPSSPK